MIALITRRSAPAFVVSHPFQKSNHESRKLVWGFQSGSNQGPLVVPETSLQRQRWLPVPLNVNQLPLNVTLTR